MEMVTIAPFGDLLRRHRVAAGLSQEALAERAGLSARAISDIERGLRRAPYRATVELLSRALGLSPAEYAALEGTAARRRGPRTAPPVSSSSELPILLTPLIGREQEVATAVSLLRRAGVRLLTLTGAGGTGKTRVGLEVAAEVAGDFADGVAFVRLASVSDPRLVLPAVARTLGLDDIPGRPWPERLVDVLRDKHLLLVLDNLEHLLAAAPSVAELLKRCPRLAVLATSRAPLRVSGERELQLPPASPGRGDGAPGVPRRYTAVELSRERVEANASDFALTRAATSPVTEIARRLDRLLVSIGLPDTGVCQPSPDAQVEHVEQALFHRNGDAQDLPSRKRALRDTIAWTCFLLSELEKGRLRRRSDIAEWLRVFGDLAAALVHPRRAAGEWGAGEPTPEAIEAKLPEACRALHARWVNAVGIEFGEDDVNASHQEGFRLASDAPVAPALDRTSAPPNR